MSPPQLSVALPVRNGANFLAEALDSILAQSLGDFTLHVSDNASDDATPEILADYARRDRRVMVSRSAELIPQAANMNRAVELTDTPWVKLFCHDDLMRGDCLASIDAAIRQHAGSKVGLIGNGERHLFANGFCTAEQADGAVLRIAGRDVVRNQLTGRNALGLPAVTTATVRREAFLALGGFDPRYLHFDIFLWHELLTSWDYLHLPSQRTVNRIHGKQVAADARAAMRTVEDYRAFLPDFLERHGPDLQLTARQRLRARSLPLGVAANMLASEIRAGRWNRVPGMLGRLPQHWLPAMLGLVPRALRKEARRLADLRGIVPNELIYP